MWRKVAVTTKVEFEKSTGTKEVTVINSENKALLEQNKKD